MRQNFNNGFEVLSADLNGISQLIERNLFERTLWEIQGQPSSTVCYGSALRVNFVSATQVQVLPGRGVHYDPTQASPESTRRPFQLATAKTLTLAAADATNPRVDIVVARALLNPDTQVSRRYKDPTTTVVSLQTVTTRFDWQADVKVVTGTAAATPAQPAVPSGYALIATIAVPAVTGPISQTNITDQRTPALRGRFQVNFNGTAGAAPVQAEEFGDMVQLFELNQGQYLTAIVKVPANYVPGCRISLSVNAYSPSATNTWALQTVSTLIRQNVDALSSTTNQRTYTPAQVTNTIANQLRLLTFQITDGIGTINNVAVNPGDAIIVQLSRAAITSGTDDSLEVRVLSGATEGVY